MTMIRLMAVAAAIGLAGSYTAADDWPQWQGSNRNRISKETGLLKEWPKEGPKLLWTFDKAGAGFGSPAIVGNRLFVLGSDDPEKGDKEFVLCVDVKEGKELWRKPLETATGDYQFLWGSGPRGTPTVDGDCVYVLGAKGDLRCFKIADGERVWAINLVKDLGGSIPTWGYSESVLIDGGHLVCTPGGKKGTLAKLDKKNGEVVWRSEGIGDGAQYSSVVVSTVGVRQYITLVQSGTFSVRASDGKLLWRSKAGANGTAVIPTAVVSDKYVFATSGYSSGCGLLELTPNGADNVKMKEVYLNKAIINRQGGVVLVGDHVYGFSERGGWICLDYLKLDKDNEAPSSKYKKLGSGSITYADGRFYCFGQDKGVCALIDANPKEWVEKGRFEIATKSKFPRRLGEIWAHPAIANGRLFLRDHEVLLAYDIKGRD
jgi:outer membrane protein assembly factor BamB